MASILIVDSQSEFRAALKSLLEGEGHVCALAASQEAARAILAKQAFNLLLLETAAPADSCLETLRVAREQRPEMAVVLIGLGEDLEFVQTALDHGVHGYLTKPASDAQVLFCAANALRLSRLEMQVCRHDEELERLVLERTEALAESEKRYRELVAAMTEALVIVDADARMIYVNDQYGEMLQYSAEELVGRPLADFLDQSSRDLLKRELEKRREGEQGRYELTWTKRDGGKLHTLVSAKPVFDDDGLFMGSIGVITDISELKRAEKEKQKTILELNQIFQGVLGGMWVLDQEFNILRMNNTLAEMSGTPAEDAVGDKCYRHFPSPLCHTPKCPLAKSISNEQQLTFDEVRTSSSGAAIPCLVATSPFLGVDGERLGIIQSFVDITERKVLEAQLMQAQKLESIGQLAAGIAHEINTPIQYVGDNVMFMREAFEDIRRLWDAYHRQLKAMGSEQSANGLFREAIQIAEEIDIAYLLDEIPKAIAQTLEGVERVASIVKAMKEFSHPGAEEKTLLDLNKAIESTVTVTRNEWKYVSEVELDLDPDLPMVPVLPGEFNQVVLNLLVNAAHAIADVVEQGSGEKGKITISTRRKGDWVEVRMTDTGTGIPENIRERIFDPFFTTKEVGKGTGQGLAIAYSTVIDKHGGTLTFESEMGKGTIFCIRLPLQSEE